MITLAVVSLPFTTGLPEDVAQNTFWFDFAAGTPSDLDLDALGLQIEGFYNNDHAAEAVQRNIAEFLSPGLTRVADQALIDFYDADTFPMGSPVHSVTWTLGPNTADGGFDAQIDEVAITLSIKASTVGVPEESGLTRPAARRRGRIYIGPLTTGSMAETLHPRVFSGVRDLLCNAAEELSTSVVPFGFVWGVYSRADDAIRPVIAAHVDDAFDTQRRRGVAPASRTSIVF